MAKKKYGQCCEVLALVLDRADRPTGLTVEDLMSFKSGSFRQQMVIHFRKAKSGDDSKYGKGTPFSDSTYAQVRFCPFCGHCYHPFKQPLQE